MSETTIPVKHVIDGQSAEEVKALWIANHHVSEQVAEALSPQIERGDKVLESLLKLTKEDRAEAHRAVVEAIDTAPDAEAQFLLSIFHDEVDQAAQEAGD